jgi:hypothetical protein
MADKQDAKPEAPPVYVIVEKGGVSPMASGLPKIPPQGGSGVPKLGASEARPPK